MRKGFYVIVLSMVLMLVFAAFALAKTEVVLWHMEQPPHRVEQFQRTIDAFNKANPDISVRQVVLDWMEAYTKVMAAIAARQQPDLMFTIPDFTTAVKSSGAVQPVDDIFSYLGERYDFIDAAVEPYNYDGHLWAVPAYGMVHMLWYRKDIFKETGLDPATPPKSWEDLLNYAKKIAEAKNIYGIGVPASKHMYTDQAIYTFMITNKAEDLFDEEGNLIFNNPRTVETYAFYKKLYELSPPDASSWTWAEPQLAFNTGKMAVAIEKGQFLLPFEKESGVSGENLGCAIVPIPEDGQRGSIYYSNGIMVLTSDNKKHEAIKKFLDYLFNPEVNGEWLAGMEPGLFLPVTTNTLQSESFWSHPVISQYRSHVELMIEQSKYGKLFGFTKGRVNPNIGRISGQNILAQVVQKVCLEGVDPAKAVEWGQEEMLKALRK
ncbi:sugar ABC transporter substrate-binding protein [Thermatribacter velox]|uniref:Sugar ABC transporter substrate-binding protein n=1 Tax=Thermatribacter velox TaxID=3039681 RepID=A0ABZ2YA50_9BACT